MALGGWGSLQRSGTGCLVPWLRTSSVEQRLSCPCTASATSGHCRDLFVYARRTDSPTGLLGGQTASRNYRRTSPGLAFLLPPSSAALSLLMSQNLLWMEEIVQNPVYLNLPKESPYWGDIGGFKWCKITSIHRSFLQLVGFWTFGSSLAV